MLEKHEVFFWLSSCSGSSVLLRSVQIWLLTCILLLRLRSGWTSGNCTGPVRRRPSGYDDEVHCREQVRVYLSVARPGLTVQRELLPSTQHHAQPVCDLFSTPVLPLRIGYITFQYVGYACGYTASVTASNRRRRATARRFFTSGMSDLHPGPTPTGSGVSARFRDAALRPSGSCYDAPSVHGPQHEGR